MGHRIESSEKSAKSESVNIEIDGRIHTFSKLVFRRMLTAASGVLLHAKQAEGSMFPRIDQMAYDAIMEIQARHSELI